MTETLELRAEVDVDLSDVDRSLGSYSWSGTSSGCEISIQFTPSEDGDGFGLSEVFEIVVAVGGAVAANEVAIALRTAVKGTIRRIGARSVDRDGTDKGITEAVEDARASKDTEPDS
jgi:hypothetical protein